MKRFLITGFQPFAGQEINSSAKLVEAIGRDSKWGANCDVLLLPVEYSSCDAIVRNQLAKHQYDYVLLLGQAAGSESFRLERVALNWIESEQKDESGVSLSGQKINPAAENAIFSSLPVDFIKGQLEKASIPSSISLSAGGFVCNYLFFQIAHFIQETDTKCGFIHVPLLPDQRMSTNMKGDFVSMSFVKQYRALQKVLENLEK